MINYDMAIFAQEHCELVQALERRAKRDAENTKKRHEVLETRKTNVYVVLTFICFVIGGILETVL